MKGAAGPRPSPYAPGTMVRSPDPSQPDVGDEPYAPEFPGALGRDLRAQRAERRRAMLELLVTVAGTLLIAAVCALILLKW